MNGLQGKAVMHWLRFCWTSCNPKAMQRFQLLHHPINAFSNRVKSHRTVPICKDIPEFSDSALMEALGWGLILDLTHLLGLSSRSSAVWAQSQLNIYSHYSICSHPALYQASRTLKLQFFIKLHSISIAPNEGQAFLGWMLQNQGKTEQTPAIAMECQHQLPARHQDHISPHQSNPWARRMFWGPGLTWRDFLPPLASSSPCWSAG